MSRLVQYRCDWCRAVLCDRGPGMDHLSIKVMAQSGLATLDSGLPGWRVTNVLEPRTYHWCGTQCMASYIAATCKLVEKK